MNWDHPDRNAQNEQLIKILVKVSGVDGSISRSELDYVVKVGRSIGFLDEKIRALAITPLTELEVPTSEKDRMTILFLLIFTVQADQVITEEEEAIIYHFGLKLGFNHLMITNFLDKAKANIVDRSKPIDLVEIIKGYHN